ncbi:unnamed protein product [Clonostachys rhizophaga]|uniref:Uncharacterized protein n=1 Tax=Clonostachys rhizophaga TaxID=160324 RepID=A0A9N9VXD9_9HYPO|nr:unnamed protein product [Clonostachys rhizophaga]
MLHPALIVWWFWAGVSVADDGDDFSNNLFSDLAPLLALFGERVTMQFISQSMGWADNLILAMGPIGIITIIISAIRVGGPKWLKALVGRARENLAAAEMELLSSTSKEVCELWNGSEVVRCMGKCSLTEFIILVPTKGINKDTRVVIHCEDWRTYLEERVAYTDKLNDSNPSSEKKEHKKAATQIPRCMSFFRNSPNEENGHNPPLDNDNTTNDEQVSNQNNNIIVIRINGPKVETSKLPKKTETPGKIGNTEKMGDNENAPNISLNCHKLASPLELWVVAIFGTTLQLGVVAYWAFASYHPTLHYPKDGKNVADYAYPCAAAGTLTLVVGMMLCSHVVESRTTEKRYVPRGKAHDIYFCWLQQEKFVNDQSFNSHIIYCKKKNKYIVLSRRDSEGGRLKTLTIFSTIIALSGFVVQFVGLRGLHWSASVTQLGIVLFMLACKAFVRRGLASPPESSGSLKSGFELEWLTKSESQMEESESQMEEPKVESQAHSMMTIRRDLGRLADWRERPSKEAIAVTKSIEIVMNTLFPKVEGTEKPTYWSIKNSKDQEIDFQIQYKNGRFTVDFMEMDAILSLWLFADSQKYSEDEPKPSREDGKTNSWLRSKGLLPGSALCLLGPYSAALHRDIWWWMPTKETPILLVQNCQTGHAKYDSAEKLSERYGRVVGSVAEYDWVEKPETRLEIRQLEEPRFDEEADNEETDDEGSAKPEHDEQKNVLQGFFATEKKTSAELVYAQHIFSAFMRAAAADESTRINPSKTTLRTEATTNGGAWKSFTVVNETLSKMAIEIQQTGLGSLEEVYQSILPPLCLSNKLPQPDEMIELARKEARAHEKAGQWEEAGEIYLSLLRRTKTYPNDTAIAIKAAATTMQFWRQVVFSIEAEMAQFWSLEPLGSKLEKQLRENNEKTFLELQSLYITQGRGRAWEDDRGSTEAVGLESFRNEFGITAAHKLARSDELNTEPWRITYDKDMDLRSADVFGWTVLHYVSTQVRSLQREWDLSWIIEKVAKSTGINARDLIEWTPLHYACSAGGIVMVQTIIQFGADVNAQGTDNFTPLHCAAYHGHEEIVAILVEAGADINFQDVFGNSPWFWAIRERRKSARDKYGETPLYLAVLFGREAIVKLLRENGAK